MRDEFVKRCAAVWRWWNAGVEDVKRQAEEDRRCEMEAHTGWWITGQGDVALVRYDPVIGRYLLDGRVWPDQGVLREYLRFCERFEGWSALGDEATVRVRERLGI